jgi:hypothetical protein
MLSSSLKVIEWFFFLNAQLHICKKYFGLCKGAREILEDMNKMTNP